jgi:hypothetical protein
MPAGPTYSTIETQTASGSSGTITFSSIPSTHTDLVLIFNGSTVSQSGIALRFNNDTASNYSITRLLGSGSAATSDRDSSQTSIGLGVSTSTSSGINEIVQIFNYANASTFKTVIARWNNASSFVAAIVGLWRKTPEAINRLDLVCSTGNFAAGSTFTLYGITAA